MNHETELKLQAYVDGELSASEAKAAEQLIKTDQQARALSEELKGTKRLLSKNEPQYRLAESREFYWSKIEREVRRSQPATSKGPAFSWPSWFSRWVLPVAGAAAVATLLVVNLQDNSNTTEMAVHQVESSEGEASALTFRSEEAKVTVVWIASR